MSDGNHTCRQCGRQWFDIARRTEFPALCTPECADAWYDAHPAEKARDGHITRRDAVDRFLARCGLLTPPRSTPLRGDN